MIRTVLLTAFLVIPAVRAAPPSDAPVPADSAGRLREFHRICGAWLADTKNGGRLPAAVDALKENPAGGAARLDKILTDPTTGGKLEFLGAGAKPAGFGAGGLSLHVLPDETELPAAARAEAERQFAAGGAAKPVAGKAPGTERLGDFRWLRIRDPKDWESLGLPAFRPGGKPGDPAYVLAWDSDVFDKDGARVRRMTLRRTPGEPWSVVRAGVARDDVGGSMVSVVLDEAGGDMMAALTKANLHRNLILAVKDTALSAPNVRSTIRDQMVISGAFTDAEVVALVAAIRAGAATPVPLAAFPAAPDGRRLTLLTDGEIRPLSADELKPAPRRIEKPRSKKDEPRNP